ncbi:hypothetical protein HAX54_030030 [Datura stramonium]|uniref:ABCC10-like N-terminal domain-containing protein n=1 Tax=Datura stramonium TaxID=4076 RepID=A0ABS8V7M1_DATST|nr:hypothetical protein [Datura stramonium]
MTYEGRSFLRAARRTSSDAGESSKEAEIVRLKAHQVEGPGTSSALQEENAALLARLLKKDAKLRDSGHLGIWLESLRAEVKDLTNKLLAPMRASTTASQLFCLNSTDHDAFFTFYAFNYCFASDVVILPRLNDIGCWMCSYCSSCCFACFPFLLVFAPVAMSWHVSAFFVLGIFVKLVVLKLCLCGGCHHQKGEIVRLQVLMMSTRYKNQIPYATFYQFELGEENRPRSWPKCFLAAGWSRYLMMRSDGLAQAMSLSMEKLHYNNGELCQADFGSMADPSSCINHVLIICFDVILLLIFLANLFSKASVRATNIPARFVGFRVCS